MDLYIANCSKQDTDFIYLIPERRPQMKTIPQGGQIRLTGLSTPALEMTIEHHRMYGAREPHELNGKVKFAGIIYSEKEIHLDGISRAIEHNLDVLTETGKELRQAAAVVADQTMLQAAPEGTTLKATHVEVVETEDRTRDQAINEVRKIQPDKDDAQDRRGHQRPRAPRAEVVS